MKIITKRIGLIFMVLGIMVIFTSCPDIEQAILSEISDITTSEEEIVQKDFDEVEIGCADGDSADSVTQNIALLTEGENGSTITWSSDNEDVVNPNGEVTRKAYVYPNSDVQVKMTATITMGNKSKTKEIEITVKGEKPDDTTTINDIKGNIADFINFSNEDGEDGVRDNLVFETSFFDATIAWESSDSTVDANGAIVIDGTTGIITLPEVGQANNDITLTATITIGDITNTKEIVLTVLALVAVESGTIDGIAAPATSQTPPNSINETEQYTATLSWDPAHTIFEAETEYTATLSLTAKPGYSFDSASGNELSIDGATSTSFSITDSTHATLVATFPATGANPVTDNNITGLTAPVAGEAPDTEVSASDQWTVESITWSDSPTTFAPGVVYTATITLNAATGLGFVNDSTFVVDGNNTTLTTSDEKTGTIIVTFPATDAIEVTFSAIEQVGGVTLLADTTALNFTFSVDPTTLLASDITVTGATKGALSGSGTTRTLEITDITVLNGETLTVDIDNPSGYTISGSPKTVTVYVGAYKIGATGPAGGLVFYIDTADEFDWEYLEVAPFETEIDEVIEGEYARFGGQGYEVDGADGLEIGDGAQNTIDIVTEYGDTEPCNSSDSYSAKYCSDLVYGGYDDWYLPSLGELEAIWNNLVVDDRGENNGVGNFKETVYWSSSEYDAYWAYWFHFGDSRSGKTYKGSGYYLRAIRSF